MEFIMFRSINKHNQKSAMHKFDDTIIEKVKEQKFLGVWFHVELSWNTETNNLRTQLSRAVSSIYIELQS